VVVGAVGEVDGAKSGCLMGQLWGERVGAVGEGVDAKILCLKWQISVKILR
jgi:hypothetical protein